MGDLKVSAVLNEKDLLLSTDHIQKSIFFILYFILGLVITYFMSLQIGKRMDLFKSKDPSQMNAASFLIVSTVKNLILVAVGMYHYIYTLPPLSDTTVEDRIAGFDALSILGAIQLAYNIYSIPVSFVLGETKDMIIHHSSVLVVSTLSTFFKSGLRYHTPYFYGVIEISTIPFATVQFFKLVFPEWIPKYPGIYSAVRIAFAIPFLTVRVFLWLPQVIDVFALQWFVVRTCESTILRMFVGFFLINTVALTFLQLYWGALIVNALIKHGGTKKEEKQE